jgi:hypothetical protein
MQGKACGTLKAMSFSMKSPCLGDKIFCPAKLGDKLIVAYPVAFLAV